MNSTVADSRKVLITFEPWFSSSGGPFSLSYLHMYEETGGKIANGTIQLMYQAGNQKSADLIQKESTGTIVIQDENSGSIFTIPVSIVNKDYSQNDNFLTMSFICSPTLDFCYKRRNGVFKRPIKDVISSLYPGKSDFRDVETDIQKDGELSFYQNNETDYELIKRLAYSYKHQSIFSFGWEGFILKEIYGNKNSKGQPDPGSPPLTLRLTEGEELMDPNEKNYDVNLFTFPYNCWEDTSGEKELSDYTEFEPINIRILKKYNEFQYVQTDYSSLLENARYNKLYQDSDYFINFRIKLPYIPLYRIGDVIVYQNTKDLYSPKPTKLPYDKFLIRSNEFYIATDKTSATVEGMNFVWISKLLGLESNGSIALGNDEDPGGTII